MMSKLFLKAGHLFQNVMIIDRFSEDIDLSVKFNTDKITASEEEN